MFFNTNVDLKISRISLEAFCSASIIFQAVARKSQMRLKKIQEHPAGPVQVCFTAITIIWYCYFLSFSQCLRKLQKDKYA